MIGISRAPSSAARCCASASISASLMAEPSTRQSAWEARRCWSAEDEALRGDEADVVRGKEFVERLPLGTRPVDQHELLRGGLERGAGDP